MGLEPAKSYYYYYNSSLVWKSSEDRKRAEDFLDTWGIDGYEGSLSSKKQEKAMERKIDRINDMMADIPCVPDEVMDWLDQKIFPGQILFFRKTGKRTTYRCTACGCTGWKKEGWKHGEKDNMDALNKVFSEVTDFGEPTVEKFKEIINPAGNKSYKKGIFFLMMYENRIAVKKFGSTPKDMTWEEFYQMTLDIFGSSAAGAKTWQNYFGTEEEKIPERTEPEEQSEQVELKEAAAVEPEKRVPEEDTEPQEHSQQQEKMTDTAGENVVEQEEPEPFENEKEPEENSQSETVEEPVKTEIAPAQKLDETQENQGMDEPVSEDCEAENESLKVENKTQEVENETSEEKNGTLEVEKVEAEIVEAPYETRKEYMDSLSTYELAGYLADEYRVQCKKEMDLGQQEKVYEWLNQKVDRYGRTAAENEED